MILFIPQLRRPARHESQAAPFRFVAAFALLLLAVFISSCARDPVDEAAWQSSRYGTAAGQGRHGRDTVGLEAGSQIAERYYYIAKYEATPEQRRVAAQIARRSPTDKLPPVHSRSKISTTSPRFIAVRTNSDSRAKSNVSVMIWDTHAEDIVGNNVYDLNATPPEGTLLRFETYAAEYVGSGI